MQGTNFAIALQIVNCIIPLIHTKLSECFFCIFTVLHDIVVYSSVHISAFQSINFTYFSEIIYLNMILVKECTLHTANLFAKLPA